MSFKLKVLLAVVQFQTCTIVTTTTTNLLAVLFPQVELISSVATQHRLCNAVKGTEPVLPCVIIHSQAQYEPALALRVCLVALLTPPTTVHLLDHLQQCSAVTASSSSAESASSSAVQCQQVAAV
jgi:hypothetical protein